MKGKDYIIKDIKIIKKDQQDIMPKKFYGVEILATFFSYLRFKAVL